MGCLSHMGSDRSYWYKQGLARNQHLLCTLVLRLWLVHSKSWNHLQPMDSHRCKLRCGFWQSKMLLLHMDYLCRVLHILSWMILWQSHTFHHLRIQNWPCIPLQCKPPEDCPEDQVDKHTLRDGFLLYIQLLFHIVLMGMGQHIHFESMFCCKGNRYLFGIQLNWEKKGKC